MPRELNRAEMGEMDAIKAEFVAAAEAAARAGFDLLGLHCAHGYLLSSFIFPLTNHRADEYGNDADDAVAIACSFALHGAAGIDVSTGQVVSDETAAYGRGYQTPYADRIHNEIGRAYGLAVIAVGASSSYDDVNSILLADAPTCARWKPRG